MSVWWETNLGAGAAGAVLGAFLGSGVSFALLVLWETYKSHVADAVTVQSMLKGMDQCLRAIVINEFLLKGSTENPPGTSDFYWTPITPLPTAFEDLWLTNSPEIHVAEGPVIFHEGLQMLAHNIRTFNELARRRDDLGVQITTMQTRDRSAAVVAMILLDKRLLELLTSNKNSLAYTRSSLLTWSVRLNQLVKLRS